MGKDDFIQIMDVVESYFDGLHRADTRKLASAFHPETHLQAPGLRLTRQQWFDRVTNRPVPQSLGTEPEYELVSVEVQGEQALVKLLCPLLGQRYVDFLSLLKEDGRWQIVNKMYATNPNERSEVCPTSTSK